MIDVEKFLTPGAITPVDAQTTSALVRCVAWLEQENDRLREALNFARMDLRLAIQEIDSELDYVPRREMEER